MKSILIKELNSFFSSPIGYLVIGVYLVVNGLFLWVFKGEFNILHAGFADQDVNQLENYYGLGGVYTDLWLSGDALGLAVAQAQNGDAFLQENIELERKETAWELSYAMPLHDRVTLQGSVYYVNNPSMEPTLDSALAVGFRLMFSLE